MSIRDQILFLQAIVKAADNYGLDPEHVSTLEKTLRRLKRV